MAIDTDKIDDAALALLYLTLHDGDRAWRGFDWGALDRLHAKGMIGKPASKANRWCSPRRDSPGRKNCSGRCSRNRPAVGRDAMNLARITLRLARPRLMQLWVVLVLNG